MKIKTICLLIIFPLYINAQSFWSAVADNDPFNKSHVTDIGLFQDSIILVSGYVSDASCPYHRLFAYDFSGKKLWEIDGDHDRIFIDSNYFFTAGYTPVDDVIGFEQVVISGYDKQGNQHFTTGYPPIPHDYYFRFTPVSIDVAEDQTILVASDRSVIKSDFYGFDITEKNLDLPSEIQNFVSVSSQTYLISTLNRMYRSDSAFILLDSLSFANSLIETVLHKDTIYALFNSDLIRMDTNLSVIDTVINTQESNFQNFGFYQGNLWIQTIDTDSINLIKIQDKEIIDTLFFVLLSHNIEFIVADDNYTFIGNSFSDQICLYNFNIPDSDIIHPEVPDIEIIDFNIDSTTVVYIEGFDTFAIGYFFDAELTIKNIGSGTINC